MAETEQGERTEEATQHRREDFRKRGQVAQTRELASVFLLFGAALLMWGLGRYFFAQVYELFNHSFSNLLVAAARRGDYAEATQFAVSKAAHVTLPIFGFFWLMSIVSSIIQIGILNNEDALEFKFDRLNPVEGFKRIFNLRSVVEGLKSILKLFVVGLVAYFILKDEIKTIPFLMSYSVGGIFLYLGTVTLKLLLGVGLLMLVISGADYFYQWWELEKEMRMTKQEVKEEVKSREGDPLNRSRVRRLQRELSTKRMMEDVKTADVIVTNPTHLAVALKYDPNKSPAPRVVAKGAGIIAEKIREMAKTYKIPIVENKPLARTMFKTLKMGQVIPRELYTAVAEVLAYVFRLRRKRSGR